jgi:hypothetical protein
MSISLKDVKLAESILYHLRNHRREGHTTAALEGVKNVDHAVLLTHDEVFAAHVSGTLKDPRKAVPMGFLEQLEGRRPCAIVLDNFVVDRVLSGLLRVVREQQEEMREMRVRLDKIHQMTQPYDSGV